MNKNLKNFSNNELQAELDIRKHLYLGLHEYEDIINSNINDIKNVLNNLNCHLRPYSKKIKKELDCILILLNNELNDILDRKTKMIHFNL